MSASLPSGAQAESALEYESWVQRFTSPDYRQVFALDSEPLQLPQAGMREFSEEGQDKLFDLAARFGEEQLEEDEFREISRNTLLSDSIRMGFSFDQDSGGLNTTSLNNRLNLSADYMEILDGEQSESATEISLEYNLGRTATLRAGYGERVLNLPQYNLAAEEGQGSQESADSDFSVLSIQSFDRDSSLNLGEDEEDQPLNNDTVIIEGSGQRVASSGGAESLTTYPGQLGVTIRPFDNLSFSADYRQEDIFNPSSRDYAILGLEYRDSLGNLRASYQFDSFSENRQSISGLELDFLDLATLSASYKLLDLEEIEDALQTEWDLGLDLNVSEFSSFSFGYQLIDSLPDMDSEVFEGQESSISASFEIRF